jgi:GTP cyclohydrolase II
VRGCLVLFTECEDVTELKVADDVRLPLQKFRHLPIFDLDIRADSRLYSLQAQCALPTDQGTMSLLVFQHRSLSHDQVLVLQSLTIVDPGEPVLIRLHDACFTSELFYSEKCDCRQQLEAAQKYVAAHGGLVIYLQQEGRGIGVVNKVKAYACQIRDGLDTVDGNRVLGLPDDLRTYRCVQDILTALGITRVALITNNMRKVEALRKQGIDVAQRIPSVVEAESGTMAAYVRTKAQRMGHVF